jgi:phage terminase large subunit-like protein
MAALANALEVLDRPISLGVIEQAIRIQQRNKIRNYYQDAGPLRRELYAKHVEFFAAGATHNERLACAANRTGKSEGLGAYEVTLHLTGLYPEWWPGRRFARPISAWCAGKTAETTRDIPQFKLLGRTTREKDSGNSSLGVGTGMIPADCIVGKPSPKGGIPDAIDTVEVRHVSGGVSTLGFKSYGKDRDSFEGTEKDVIWLDEEPPADVNRECSIRLMATKPGERSGLKLITFTPLEGYTEVVNDFLESDDPDKWFIQIGWKDVPHLSPEVIAEMSRKFMPYELKARSEGVPSAGEGVIYPIDIEDLLYSDMPIPEHWPRCASIDFGKTAIVWGALNRDTDTLYIYKEYYSEEYNTLLHANALKGNAHTDTSWIPVVGDPAGLGSNQVDGRNLINIYRTEHDVKIQPAINAVEAGIHAVWDRMTSGRFKVARSCQRWQKEFLRYRRSRVETTLGEAYKIVKKHDHLMDASRYLVVSGIPAAKVKPKPKSADPVAEKWSWG